jgi:hypothetical protein
MILFFSLPMLSSKVATPTWWFNASCFESLLIYCPQCIVQWLIAKWSFKGSLFSEDILTWYHCQKKRCQISPMSKNFEFPILYNE